MLDMTATLLKFPNGYADDIPQVPKADYPLRKEHVDPPHIIVRETPFYRYQDNLNLVLHYRAQLKLSTDLAMEYAGEPSTPHTVSKWAEMWDRFGVWLCRNFHRTPTFTPGDNFSRCPTCSRKYALPWADLDKVASDVYICNEPFVAPTEPVVQAHCRNGLRK